VYRLYFGYFVALWILEQPCQEHTNMLGLEGKKRNPLCYSLIIVLLLVRMLIYENSMLGTCYSTEQDFHGKQIILISVGCKSFLLIYYLRYIQISIHIDIFVYTSSVTNHIFINLPLDMILSGVVTGVTLDIYQMKLHFASSHISCGLMCAIVHMKGQKVTIQMKNILSRYHGAQAYY
ncbi:hypothetical protein ACJX0J_029647, partial [Zea mays]